MRKNQSDIPAVPVIQVIERMFSLIDVLASREEAISLKEISEKTGLHPSTTHRILNDLAVGRFVDRPEAGSYRLGMRLLELGNLVKGRLNVRDAALGPMRELHKLTQQPVNLSMRQGDEIVYIERSYSERSGMQVVRAIGGRAPLHLTSTGKLFLAADDPQRVRSYATRTGLAGHTRNSITQLPALERELSKARQYGIARDNEELELGVRCMAAGIYDDQGKLVAGLSISAPADRLDEGWLPKLQATANEISGALGFKDGMAVVSAPAPARTARRQRPRDPARGAVSPQKQTGPAKGLFSLQIGRREVQPAW
jgi:DNA-binding IclR family transcriptional regulator